MRRSATTWHRKPFDATPGNDVPERITLSLAGQSFVMVKSTLTGTYVPMVSDQYMELHVATTNGKPSWTLYTAAGTTYQFEQLPSTPQNLWLLTRIDDTVGGDHAELRYETPDNGCGHELDLAGFSYTYTADGQTPLYDVELQYKETWITENALETKLIPRLPTCAPPDESGRALLEIGQTDIENTLIPRTRVLDKVDIFARDNLDRHSTLRVLEEYALTYPDDREPRLRSVTVDGEDTPGLALPVATYDYSSPTDAGLALSAPDVADWSAVTARGIASSIQEGQIAQLPFSGVFVSVSTTKSRYLVRDLTGDGVADVLVAVGDTWTLYPGHANDHGATFDTGVVTTWTASDGPREVFEQRTWQFTPSAQSPTDDHDRMATTGTTAEIVDWNGDGRPDVIDALPDAPLWRVWLNLPDPQKALRWKSIDVDTASFKAMLASNHLEVDAQNSMIPLDEEKSWPESLTFACAYVDDHQPCPTPGQEFVVSDRSDTVTQWMLSDVNGDSFPDVVANTAPSIERKHTNGVAQICHAETIDGIDHNVCGTEQSADWMDATDGSDAHLSYVLNRGGVLVRMPADAARAVVQVDLTNGLSTWTTGARTGMTGDEPNQQPTFDPTVSWHRAGLFDEHALGIPRHSEFLADPSPAHLGLEQFDSDRDEACRVKQLGTYDSIQTSGLADLDGDGIPDLVRRSGTRALHTWSVRFGTSAGFGKPFEIETSAIDQIWTGGFAISDTQGNCFGASTTVSGLMDIDGDGRADFVWQGDDFKFHHVHLRISGGLVGRELVSIGNGYGAHTHIAYRNNKIDTHSAHQVPAPEIVVGETVTTGTDPDGAPTDYAYGTPEMRYDPVFNRVSFAGYQRSVSVTLGTASPRAGRGVATIVDHVQQAPAGAGFEAFALGGRVFRTTRLEGVFDHDASPLLSLDTTDSPTLDARARAQKEQTSRVKELPVEPLAGFVGIDECVDIDVNQQSPFIGSDGPLCQHAGIVHDEFTRSWEGTHEGPANRVEEFTAVEEVDDHGRTTSLHSYGDVAVGFDDTCTTIDYAAPNGSALPTLTVISAMRTDDCGAHAAGSGNGSALPLAGSRFEYDGQPEGIVTRGRMTAEILEDYNTTDGSLVNEHVASSLSYDDLGNVSQATEARGGDHPATCTSTYARDDFGVTMKSVSTVASDLPRTYVRQFLRSTWPSKNESTTGLNGEQTVTKRDPFGRITEVHLVDGASDHLQVRRQYRDASPREIIETRYPATLPVVAHLHLDSLGRPRYREAELGIDYNAHRLISDFVQYDELGRVAFTAAPFESIGAFDPSLMSPPWGVTTVYDDAGRVVRQVETAGVHPELSQTVVPDVYVSTLSYAWRGNRAVTRASGPRDNDPSSVAFGAFDETQVTALGWSTEDSRTGGDGTRLDLVRRGYDRLGRETTLHRFRNPTAATADVEWTTVFDTSGRVLASQEPGSSIVSNDYDDWGDLVQTSWLDGSSDLRIQRRGYDGLGRQVQVDLLTRDLDTDTDSIESSEHDFFDVASGSATQPSSRLLGRLSYIETTGVGDAYFGYDAFGRVTTEAYSLVGAPTMRADRAYTAGGELSELDFTTPAGADHIGYTLDSAARTTTVTDLIAHRALFDASGHNIDAKGRYLKVFLGNGVRETNDFANSGREELVHQGFQTNSGVRNHNLGARDGDGRLLDEVWTGSGSVHLVNEYDRMGRLGRQGQPGSDERFLYDALGNVVTKRNVNSITQNRDFSYDPNDLDQLCTALAPGATSTACGFTYDGAGNVIGDTSTGSARAFAYDAASRIQAIQRGNFTANFLYGPGGSLAREDLYNGTNLTRRTWTFGDLIEQTTRDGHTEVDRRIPGPEGLGATLRTDLATHETAAVYVHGDGRGNRFFTKSDGKVTQDVRYRAYGGVLADGGVTTGLTFTDDLWNGGDDLRDVGVDLLGARIYDPALGRFLQRDPLALTSASSTANPYAFALGDPVDFSDPSGLCAGPEDYGCNAIAGGAVLAVAAYGLITNSAAHSSDPAPRGATAVFVGVTASYATTRSFDANAFGGGLRDWAKDKAIDVIKTGACVSAEAYCIYKALEDESPHKLYDQAEEAALQSVPALTNARGANSLFEDLSSGDEAQAAHVVGDTGFNAVIAGSVPEGERPPNEPPPPEPPGGGGGGGGSFTAFHGTTGENIRGIIDRGGLLPRNGSVFLGETPNSTFAHGADVERGAAFSAELRVDASSAVVERIATPGVPRTIVVRTNQLVPAEISRLHIRTPAPEGGFSYQTVEGREAILAYLGF